MKKTVTLQLPLEQLEKLEEISFCLQNKKKPNDVIKQILTIVLQKDLNEIVDKLEKGKKNEIETALKRLNDRHSNFSNIDTNSVS